MPRRGGQTRCRRRTSIPSASSAALTASPGAWCSGRRSTCALARRRHSLIDAKVTARSSSIMASRKRPVRSSS
eukprot:3212391-Prymnesium_polylepis.1